MGERGSPWEKLRGKVILGSEMFIERVWELLGSKEVIREIPRLQRFAGRPALEVLFPTGEHHAKNTRNPAIFKAHVSYGYTLKKIADYLDIHYTTVSKIIKAEDSKN